MEFFNYNLKLKSLDEQGKFDGYASTTGNKDQDNEVFLPGAFRKTLSERMIFPLLWMHDTRLPLGIGRIAGEDERGLPTEGELNLETSQGREKYSLMKQGAIRGLSIGFRPVKDYIENGVRYFKEVALQEISLTTLGFNANPLAVVTNIKAVIPFQDLPLVDIGHPWDAGKAEERVREWAGAGDGPNEKYRRAFLWYDEENADNFTAYKLPIGDIIDGSLKAIPRAIFTSAGALQGARGGVRIPREDVPKLRANLSRYYKKLDRVPPWEEGTKALDEAIIAFGASMIDGGVELRRMKALLETLEPAGTTSAGLEAAELMKEIKSFKEDIQRWTQSRN